MGLQEVTGGNIWLQGNQRVTEGYHGLQRGYNGLKEVTGVNKRLQEVTGV